MKRILVDSKSIDTQNHKVESTDNGMDNQQNVTENMNYSPAYYQ